jgi:hypothetical protein
MTVADNIAYGLQQHEVTRQDIEYAATEVYILYTVTYLFHSYSKTALRIAHRCWRLFVLCESRTIKVKRCCSYGVLLLITRMLFLSQLLTLSL